MLTANTAKSIEGTERYFETLNYSDYYTGVEVGATWQGKCAKQLGLEEGSPVTKEQFKALLSGKHPVTEAKLAQRIRKDRRPGVDLTFSVPKSCSLLWAVNQDEKILDALRDAVHETMQKDVEPLMCRRVRDGKNVSTQNREATGAIVYADFLHKTARPVDGKVDPHLHVHCFVMNHTSVDGKNFAAEPEEIFHQKKSLQARFEARLARTLEHELGYSIVKSEYLQSNKLKAGWEIDGVSRATINRFSTRTQQVEDYAEEHGIKDEAAKAKLGAKIRSKKEKGLTLVELRQQWRSRLTPQEKVAFERIERSKSAPKQAIDEAAAEEASVRYALDHHLYRESAVESHFVLATALEHGLTLSPEQVDQAMDGEGILHAARETRGVNRHFVTTAEVLKAETRMISFARDGRGTRKAIAREEHVFERDWLNPQQKAAVNHVLQSRDSVTAITGGAGTGKSSLMEEAAAAIRKNGREVHVFAPSTGAREVLQEKGFDSAQTVEHLLRNEKLHPELKGQVIWIDEAGLLDVRAMNGVFDIAKANDCRVVLSGDTRQHASPRRGEAMRILERDAGLRVAQVDEIQRQQGKYKQAVELISLGHHVVDPKTGLTGMLAGFDMLDRLGKVKEIAGEERHEALAKTYLSIRKSKASALIVAPTHIEGKAITERIRTELREAGAIGEDEREFGQLRSLNLSDAEKSVPSKFSEKGLIVQFHQNAKGFRRGERYRVAENAEGTPVLQPLIGKGQNKAIPHQLADRFEVYVQEPIGFSKGDKIRFSLGGTAQDGKGRISNGRLDEIDGFDRAGNIRLRSGMTVSKDYGHWAHGVAITSFASQGKDRDISIASLGAESLPAVNAKQFYVSVSRGRKDVEIFVDDKAAVRRAIQNAGEQLSATELFGSRTPQVREMERQRSLRHNVFLTRVRTWWQAHMSKQTSTSQQPRVAATLVPTTRKLDRGLS